ncbi:MAG: hypothetical protein KDI46_09935 [Alphaproteobacteria bacterium]|nr:hypothetical protein [Alphaproteobacteria bacterium]
MNRDQIRFIDYSLYILLALVFAARVYTIPRYGINWDETFYLSKIYDFADGRLSALFQQGGVYFFQWLRLIPGTEVEKIIAGRFAMLGLNVVTGAMIFLISRQFFSKTSSLLAVLSYFCVSYVCWQGASFRADPLITALMMSALFIAITKPETFFYGFLTALLIALSGFVSIKSVFLAIPLGLALLVRYKEAQFDRRLLHYTLFVSIGSVLFFGALVMLHSTFLSNQTTRLGEQPTLHHHIEMFILNAGFFHSPQYIVTTLIFDFGFWLLLLWGLVLAFKELRTSKLLTHSQLLILLSLAVPLFTLIFYRNVFPYYYAFMLAPVSVLCGMSSEYFIRKRKNASFLFFALTGLFSANLLIHNISRTNLINMQTQKEFIETVHKIFPEPVPYLDTHSMISSYPKVGFFMSTAGVNRYLNDERYFLEDLMIRQHPLFVIASNTVHKVGKIGNSDPNSKMVLGDESDTFYYKLKPEDQGFINQNYLHHWRQLYVAGKTFENISRAPHTFDLYIGGPYTVEADHPVTIDGARHIPGEVVLLKAGTHTILSHSDEQTATLRWGDRLYRPQETLKPEDIPPLYTTF